MSDYLGISADSVSNRVAVAGFGEDGAVLAGVGVVGSVVQT